MKQQEPDIKAIAQDHEEREQGQGVKVGYPINEIRCAELEV